MSKGISATHPNKAPKDEKKWGVRGGAKNKRRKERKRERTALPIKDVVHEALPERAPRETSCHLLRILDANVTFDSFFSAL